MAIILSIAAFFAILPYALAGLAMVVVIAVAIYLVISSGIRSFRKWSQTGFCRHEYVIHDTAPYGPNHTYKCNKCGTKRVGR